MGKNGEYQEELKGREEANRAGIKEEKGTLAFPSHSRSQARFASCFLFFPRSSPFFPSKGSGLLTVLRLTLEKFNFTKMFNVIKSLPTHRT